MVKTDCYTVEKQQSWIRQVYPSLFTYVISHMSLNLSGPVSFSMGLYVTEFSYGTNEIMHVKLM